MIADTGADHRSDPPREPIPQAALWLGALGAVPLVGLAAGSHLFGDAVRDAVMLALAGYGAVILSFLGGIHWGLAMAGAGSAADQDASFRRLALSVLPSLIGWASLLLPVPFGLLTLAVAFAGMLFLDGMASHRREVPSWYLRLRWPLTLAVIASVTAGALA